ncbi:MAG: 3-oxoacyl-ACP reductase FabG [Dehalococcoidia bacterium]|nr:3-oxoacyl-ACP reductase FabG [Dehalococcoidia bacterium]
MGSAPFSLAGKVALITGGGRGIGRETALWFAKAGADVVVGDIFRGVDSVAAEVESKGCRSFAVHLDVTDSAQVHEAVAEANRRMGKVDILVNSAGTHLVQRFADGDVKDWERLLRVNLLGTMICCHAVIGGMMERSFGKIVNIASDAGRVGSMGQAVYGASKGGVIAFTRNLAVEMARYKVNVNCVSPGLINTDMWNATRADKPKLAQAYEGTVPWKRLGEPSEIAAAVMFLVTDEAEYITGQTLSVNGGVVIA